jgi:DMATS type aromatic prenyltransferase
MNGRSNKSPCDAVAQELRFPNPDQEFWWQATAPSLGRLLASCQYSTRDQSTHLRWYGRFIVPALGPRPILGVKPKFQPCPVYDGSAVEHSINWRELDSKRTVRFTIEAVCYGAGTDADPFNQKATRTLLTNIAKETPGLNLERFDIFANRLFFSAEAAKSLIPRIPSGTPLSQVWVAFDLLCGEFMAKAYFMPVLKMIETNVTTKNLVFDALHECNGQYGSFEAPLSVLDSYLESFPPEEPQVVEMVAVDCIDSPTARIKIYLRTTVNTLAKAKKAFCLGGRLTGPTIEEGLQALGELWPILFRIASDDIEDHKVFSDGSYCGNAIEMRPGHAEPEVKIHIPVRKIKGTDAQICESLSSWFQRRGHAEFAAAYKEELKTAL